MEFICWCNENNGFLTAVLSIIGLLLSMIAIVVSVSTARMPYKKRLLNKSVQILAPRRIMRSIRLMSSLKGPGFSILSVHMAAANLPASSQSNPLARQ